MNTKIIKKKKKRKEMATQGNKKQVSGYKEPGDECKGKEVFILLIN
jgi:hypothetical protein